MQRLISALLIGSTSLVLPACSGGGDVGVQVRAVSSSGGALAASDSSGTAFRLSSALVYIRHIEIDLPDGERCESIGDELRGATCATLDDKIRIAGPFVVDLMTGVAEPSLADVVIPAGVYKRVDIRVDDGDPADGLIEPGSPLDDYSLVVTAEFLYQGEPAWLNLALNFDEDVRIETLAGVAIEPSTDLSAKLVVDDWLAGVDLVGCLDRGDVELDANRHITIDDDQDGACGGIEDTIKNNMKNSGKLD